jgi:hypothetical protein
MFCSTGAYISWRGRKSRILFLSQSWSQVQRVSSLRLVSLHLLRGFKLQMLFYSSYQSYRYSGSGPRLI